MPHDQSDERRHTIGNVALSLGIAIDTLRAWGRRYPSLQPSRDVRGRRVYSDLDVARLRDIKALLGRGLSIGQLARMTPERLRDLVHRRGLPRPEGAVVFQADADAIQRGLCDAVRHCDVQGALTLMRQLDRADLARHVIRLVEHVQSGAADAPRLCRAGATIRVALAALLAEQHPSRDAPVIVNWLVSGEDAGRSLLLGLIAAACGWRVAPLAAVCARDVVETAGDLRARAVLISITEDDSVMANALGDLERELPAEVRVLAVGPAARRRSAGLPRVLAFESLEVLRGRLDAAAREAPAARN